MSVREQQKEKRRQEILGAALELFISKGYAATRVSDIATLAGMSTGLMFHYFESKEKLYEALIEIGISGPMSMIPPEEVPPLVFFEMAAKQIFQYIRTQPFVAKMFVLMSQAFHNKAAPECVKQLLGGFDLYAKTAVLMKKGQESGLIREGDPYALALLYWCAIHGVAEQISLTPEAPCPESEWIVDMIRRRT